MPIYAQVFPTEQNPGKYQIEQLFRNLSKEQITPQVIKDFGLIRSQFSDEWQVTIPLNQARAKFRALYNSLPARTKASFQMAYLTSAVNYANAIIQNIEAALEKPDCLKEQREKMLTVFLAVANQVDKELADTD